MSASCVERHFRSWRENEGRWDPFFPLAAKANQLTIQGVIPSITFPGTIDLCVQFNHQYKQRALSKYSFVDMIQIVKISLVSGKPSF